MFNFVKEMGWNYRGLHGLLAKTIFQLEVVDSVFCLVFEKAEKLAASDL